MISDLEARKISSEWHGGGGTALYVLSSTGAIDTARTDHTILVEIGEIKESLEESSKLGRGQEDEDIEALWEYVCSIGPRGPVDGWSTLTW